MKESSLSDCLLEPLHINDLINWMLELGLMNSYLTYIIKEISEKVLKNIVDLAYKASIEEHQLRTTLTFEKNASERSNETADVQGNIVELLRSLTMISKLLLNIVPPIALDHFSNLWHETIMDIILKKCSSELSSFKEETIEELLEFDAQLKDLGNLYFF